MNAKRLVIIILSGAIGVIASFLLLRAFGFDGTLLYGLTIMIGALCVAPWIRGLLSQS